MGGSPTDEVKTPATQDPAGLPAEIKAPGRGFEEGTEKEDLIIPRVKLLQGISPEVMDPASTLKAGQIINSLDKAILPNEFVPIFKFTNWIRFNPRKKEDPNFDPAFDPGEILWQSNKKDDPRVIAEGEFGPNGEKPMATKFMNFLCYFPGQPGPVILSFSSVSFKAGKKLISLALRAGGDMFERKYRLSVKQVTGEQGTYFVFDVDPAGPVSAVEANVGLTWYTNYANRAQEIKVHQDAQAEQAQ